MATTMKLYTNYLISVYSMCVKDWMGEYIIVYFTSGKFGVLLKQRRLHGYSKRYIGHKVAFNGLRLPLFGPWCPD